MTQALCGKLQRNLPVALARANEIGLPRVSRVVVLRLQSGKTFQVARASQD